jgi:dienelactone hydrolase
MTIVARRLTQEADGIPGYIAHPDGTGQRPGVLMAHHAPGITGDYKIDAYRLAELGFSVFVPSLFIANGQLVQWHFLSDANHGFRHPDNEGYQPAYADLVWPLVTSVLQRTV